MPGRSAGGRSPDLVGWLWAGPPDLVPRKVERRSDEDRAPHEVTHLTVNARAVADADVVQTRAPSRHPERDHRPKPGPSDPRDAKPAEVHVLGPEVGGVAAGRQVGVEGPLRQRSGARESGREPRHPRGKRAG